MKQGLREDEEEVVKRVNGGKNGREKDRKR